jgi:peptidyl-prolyl cis-trans isomerase SurA
MFKQATYFLPLVFAVVLVSCAPRQSEIVVAEYGGKEIHMKEFEDAYAKSAGGYEAAAKDSLSKLKSFLDLFVNFKMKLRDAEVRGYASDSTMMSELTDYKKRVGVTYLLEKKLVEPGIENLYERRKSELRVSHIMIRPDSTGEAAAKAKAQAVLDSIKAGASFEEMAMKYSNDNYSKMAGGDIYYVTAGLLPVEFEDGMYSTPAGKVYPQIVQTKFGYHIIKVTEIQPRIPQIKASHILAAFRTPDGKIDTVAARAKIDSAAAELKNGVEFAEVAKKYSDDGSKQNGGDLGYFERRSMVKEFDEAAFKLNVGEVSGIIRTQFGYHIIKVTDKKTNPAISEEKEALKRTYKQQRFNTDYEVLVDSLKKAFNFTEVPLVLSEIAYGNDTVKVGDELNGFDKIKDKVLYTYNNKSFSAGQFIAKLDEQAEFKGKPIRPDMLKAASDKISGDLMLEDVALGMDKTNEQFAALMDDYKNGIYIFKLQEQEIWNKINMDTTKLYQYYTQTKDKYNWPERVSYNEIFSRKDSLINVYYSYLENGENFDSVASKYTERPGLKAKAGFYPLTDAKASPIAEEAYKLTSAGSYSKPFKVAGGFAIVKLAGRDAARPKTFEEAKAEVSGSYQEVEGKRLDSEYIDSLKKKYSPVMYYEALEKAFPKAADAATITENTDKAAK